MVPYISQSSTEVRFDLQIVKVYGYSNIPPEFEDKVIAIDVMNLSQCRIRGSSRLRFTFNIASIGKGLSLQVAAACLSRHRSNLDFYSNRTRLTSEREIESSC
ncbi:hypothetical protein AFLA_004249 [Aspergillus flavus NRRL3357]|nr:hypothetical protein AFLA_004249 [Aspergillus flavus NRRL3357]